MLTNVLDTGGKEELNSPLTYKTKQLFGKTVSMVPPVCKKAATMLFLSDISKAK